MLFIVVFFLCHLSFVALSGVEIDNVKVVTVVDASDLAINPQDALKLIRSLRLNGGGLAWAPVVALIAVNYEETEILDEKFWDAMMIEFGSLNVEIVFTQTHSSYSELQIAINSVTPHMIGRYDNVLFLNSDLYVLRDLVAYINQRADEDSFESADMYCPVATYSYSSLCESSMIFDYCNVFAYSPGRAEIETLSRDHVMCATDALLMSKDKWIALRETILETSSQLMMLSENKATFLDKLIDGDQVDAMRIYEQLILFWSSTTLGYRPLAYLSSLAQPSWLSIMIAPSDLTSVPGDNILQSISCISDFRVMLHEETNMCFVAQAVDTIRTDSEGDAEIGVEDNQIDYRALGAIAPDYKHVIDLVMNGANTNLSYSCGVNVGTLRFNPAYDYFEVHDINILQRARIHHRGVTVSHHEKEDILPNYSSYLQRKVLAITVFGQPDPTHIQVSFVDLWTKHIEDAGIHSVNLLSLPNLRLFEEALDFYLKKLHEEIKLSSRPPCIIMYPTRTAKSAHIDRTLLELGMIPLSPSRSYSSSESKLNVEQQVEIAVSSYCEASEFARLESLLPENVALFMKNCLTTPNVSCFNILDTNEDNNIDKVQIREVKKDTDFNDSELRPLVESMETMEMKAKNNDEIKVVVGDNVFSDSVVAQLKGRMRQLPITVTGSTSFFISFDGICDAQDTDSLHEFARSSLEYLILAHVAPAVLGDLCEASKRGYLGAEWWTQSRLADDPKEYHLDTAITWCRDNGWAEDLLSACHFYPAIGTVTYFGEGGGPTAVFNQNMSKYGINPVLPEEVAVVYPKQNRMMLFDGTLYHGVLKTNEIKTLRSTLLVNYWRTKTAGEAHTPSTFLDGIATMFFKANSKQLDQREQEHSNSVRKSEVKVSKFKRNIVSQTRIEIERDLIMDFVDWQDQIIPKEVEKSINKTCVHGIRLSCSGFAVLKLKTNSDYNYNINVDAHQGYTRWMDWKVDHDTGEILAGRLDIDAVRQWRTKMPGGNPFD